jgi:hypothetical protein
LQTLTYVGELKSVQVIVDNSSRQAVFAAVFTCLPPEQLMSNVCPAGGGSLQVLAQPITHTDCDGPPSQLASRMAGGVQS